MKFFRIAAIVLALAPALQAGEVSPAVLAEINLARTQPRAYARIVASRGVGRSVDEAVRFLERVKPLPALAPSRGLALAALSHVLAQGPSGGCGHGRSASRVSRHGRWLDCMGENIDYGSRDPRRIVVRLIVDDGVAGRGHRVNIFSKNFRVAGAAVGSHARYGAMCVIDFAGGFVERGAGVAAR